MQESEYGISGYDVTPDGHIKPSALLRYMQSAASDDSEKLGAGYDRLLKEDMVFVMSKVAVELNGDIRFGKMLGVRTWDRGAKGACFERDYVISADGAPCARASSRWVLLRFSTRAILRPDLLGGRTVSNAWEHVGVVFSRKLRLPEGAVHKTRYTVPYTDLDINGHVNNCRYADYMLDFGAAYFSGGRTERFEIHYTGELRHGDAVEISSSQNGKLIGVYGGARDGSEVFSAQMLVSDK